MLKQKKSVIYLSGLILIASVVVFYLVSHTNQSNKKNIYNGESNNWSASYTVNINETSNHKDNNLKYSNVISSNLCLSYKKYPKGSDTIKIIEYNLKSLSRKLRGEVNFSSQNKAGKVEITNSNKNIAYENGDEEIQLTIKWNGKEEVIKLKKG
ncbi:hypothetical protein [Ruminiclostridium papyrosolvens]|uniref:Uncharacterized protein n=1 Tax=Ruminiclostridium papyrosolvens C7 TaxID=1330534 RepID=U4R622_9FIRM|nr:hypothetical protein [Ruminiclostridium papyrosolvens]EPR13897.1 hypothetical protein L323_02135 [Ruminiclostridium papyrosolvens C7]